MRRHDHPSGSPPSLQEVDEFGTFYKEEFEASGYGVVYKQRTGMKKDGSLVAFRSGCLFGPQPLHGVYYPGAPRGATPSPPSLGHAAAG
mmetsp:Transcript_34918/g.110310  ORF Transcript_34918/g.110310 Transcript_34918/m.110310 type:complete len:89 (+) Transcript_34918:454-720(+)